MGKDGILSSERGKYGFVSRLENHFYGFAFGEGSLGYGF